MNDVAEYKGKEYDWTTEKGKIKLLSDFPEIGFEKDFVGYVKIVDRSECDRVYYQEPRFCYQGVDYRYGEEKDGKIMILCTYDENDKDLIRLSYDEYGKWVPLADGKKVIWTKEY